jgi:NAD-dependent dihydropyrimidine dehydrogenase PreA subunit
MAYVITEPCINVKDAVCVEVCPCDCIHPTKYEPGYSAASQLYIEPDECIDCGACEPECPVGAIFLDEDVPVEWQRYIDLNARAFRTETAH